MSWLLLGQFQPLLQDIFPLSHPIFIHWALFFFLSAWFLYLVFVRLLIYFVTASLLVPSWLQGECLGAVVLGVHLLLEPLSYWNSNFSKPKQSKAICGHCKAFRNKACWYFPHLCQLTWIHVEQISYFWVTGVYCRNEGVFQDRKSCDKEQLCCSSFAWILL